MARLYLFLQGAFGEMVFQRVRDLNPLVYTYDVSVTRRKTDRAYLREGRPVKYIHEKRYESQKIPISPEDIVVCAGWSKDFFHSSPHLFPVYHAHNSLLPLYRGYGAVSEQFLRGVAVGGVTLYRDNGKVDAGGVAYQEKIRIALEDTPLTHLKKCADALSPWIRALAAGEEPVLTEQDDTLSSGVGRTRQKKALLDFHMSAISVYNQIRAYSAPYFGSHFYREGKKITVWKALMEKWAGIYGEGGEIIGQNRYGVEIACGEGSVILTEIETDGTRYTADNINI